MTSLKRKLATLGEVLSDVANPRLRIDLRQMQTGEDMTDAGPRYGHRLQIGLLETAVCVDHTTLRFDVAGVGFVGNAVLRVCPCLPFVFGCPMQLVFEADEFILDFVVSLVILLALSFRFERGLKLADVLGSRLLVYAVRPR